MTPKRIHSRDSTNTVESLLQYSIRCWPVGHRHERRAARLGAAEHERRAARALEHVLALPRQMALIRPAATFDEKPSTAKLSHLLIPLHEHRRCKVHDAPASAACDNQ